jgi:hypothetical protein
MAIQLAGRESHPIRKSSLGQLSEAKERHASPWVNRLRELDGAEPIYHGSLTGEANSLRIRAGEHHWAVRRLEAEESRGSAQCGCQLKDTL